MGQLKLHGTPQLLQQSKQVASAHLAAVQHDAPAILSPRNAQLDATAENAQTLTSKLPNHWTTDSSSSESDTGSEYDQSFPTNDVQDEDYNADI